MAALRISEAISEREGDSATRTRGNGALLGVYHESSLAPGDLRGGARCAAPRA